MKSFNWTFFIFWCGYFAILGWVLYELIIGIN